MTTASQTAAIASQTASVESHIASDRSEIILLNLHRKLINLKI
jgi:acetolactate synthase regulatory subunit